MGKEMGHGLNGIRMDRRKKKKLTRMELEMGNRLIGVRMDRNS
jgi:hypothetical protein